MQTGVPSNYLIFLQVMVLDFTLMSKLKITILCSILSYGWPRHIGKSLKIKIPILCAKKNFEQEHRDLHYTY